MLFRELDEWTARNSSARALTSGIRPSAVRC